MKFAQRTHTLDTSHIRALFEQAAKLKNPVNLSLGQPDFDTPPNVKQAASEAIFSGKNGYVMSAGIPPFKESVDACLNAEGISAQSIMAISGASGGLMLALLALADENTEVLIADPYFLSYDPLIRLTGARPKIIDTYPDFKLTPELIESHFSPKTTVMIFNSPANPTGIAYTSTEIKALASCTRRLGITVIADEVYNLFCYDFEHHSWLKEDSNALLIRTLGKSWGVPGWRIGYAAGPQNLIEQMIMLQQFTFVCVPTPFQWAGITAMKTDMSKVRNEYQQKRDFIYQELKNYYSITKPGGAFYLYPKAPSKDGDRFYKKCIERELLIVPGKAFSKHNSHFRLSYAASQSVLEQGVEILKIIADS